MLHASHSPAAPYSGQLTRQASASAPGQSTSTTPPHPPPPLLPESAAMPSALPAPPSRARVAWEAPAWQGPTSPTQMAQPAVMAIPLAVDLRAAAAHAAHAMHPGLASLATLASGRSAPPELAAGPHADAPVVWGVVEANVAPMFADVTHRLDLLEALSVDDFGLADWLTDLSPPAWAQLLECVNEYLKGATGRLSPLVIADLQRVRAQRIADGVEARHVDWAHHAGHGTAALFVCMQIWSIFAFAAGSWLNEPDSAGISDSMRTSAFGVMLGGVGVAFCGSLITTALASDRLGGALSRHTARHELEQVNAAVPALLHQLAAHHEVPERLLAVARLLCQWQVLAPATRLALRDQYLGATRPATAASPEPSEPLSRALSFNLV